MLLKFVAAMRTAAAAEAAPPPPVDPPPPHDAPPDLALARHAGTELSRASEQVDNARSAAKVLV